MSVSVCYPPGQWVSKEKLSSIAMETNNEKPTFTTTLQITAHEGQNLLGSRASQKVLKRTKIILVQSSTFKIP